MNQELMPIPRDFLCPITREIMQNPVVLIEDGRSYELSAIEAWLRDHNSSPMTNQTLTDRRWIHNYNLKSAIEEYCSQRQAIASLNQFLAFNVCSGRIPSEWEDKPTLKIRISLLGGSNVGKSTIARYLQYGEKTNFIRLNTTTTVGHDLIFFYLDQLFENKYVITVQLTDIPGMERYESCCDNHFRTCHGALLVADSTDIDTLERIELYWYKQLHLKGKDDVEPTLICNKSDLFQENCDDEYRRIFLANAEHFASLHSMAICYTSALRGDNIRVMFKQLILRVLHSKTLLKQIKADDNVYDTASVHLSDRLSSSSRETNIFKTSSINCC
ncbi:unnamed protein product [Adineta ricciae]|uniref:U-box domain-containing protein n=1 Tax=Adineta ricciae TaxID=249248 RepID=A0A814P1F5_ADIRI|nr:unnamed protein product [Adineta ricciae]CAF1101090.1 unnamed protein product [Adineta ricciae]